MRAEDARQSIELDTLQHTVDYELQQMAGPAAGPNAEDEQDSLSDATNDKRLDQRTVRKLDLILLPFLSLLFLFNSLDKSNIGSAETGHFTKDTGLPASALNVSVACFFAVFVALQPVGAAFGRKYGMARWVPGCMALWGLCTALHVAVRKEWQLILLRIMIGTLEAGFYPTTVSYLSLFYTRYEFAKRLGFFYGQAAVAGALGGLLSWAVFKHLPEPSPGPDQPPQFDTDEVGTGWKSWQILFMIEGATTFVIALIGFFWLPHSADTAWFLSTEEREWAEGRIERDRDTHGESQYPSRSAMDAVDEETGHDDGATDQAPSNLDSEEEASRLLQSYQPSSSKTNTRRRPSEGALSTKSITADTGLSRADVVAALSDWKVWYLLICNILSAIPAAAFSVFLPLIIRGLVSADNDETKVAPARANLLTVPPFLAGACVLWIFTAWSDRRRERLVPILYGLAILLAGLTATVMLPQTAYAPRYIALTVLLSGSFVASPLTVAWLTNNTLEPGKRAVVLGINGWGNLAGVFSAVLFAPRFEKHGYVIPFYITLACVLVAFVGFMAFRALLVNVNAQRDALTKDWGPDEFDREALLGDVGGEGGRGEGWFDRFVGGRRGGRVGDEKLTFRYGL